ncbi:MAG: hypothetical protein KA383_15420 [Phycisphaerae bacterium]|nr:hypothetical protein [Phycisphaerae bacterium]
MHRKLAQSAVLLLLVLGGATLRLSAGEPAEVELLKTDSAAPYVHRLTLYDHDGKAINPKDEPAVPYSPAMTCGKCHPVGQISHGWHFNAWDPNVPAGRSGEPWFLVDQRTGTVLPISGRGWPGTYKPEDVGLSNWEFVLRFGAHTPGGGYGAPSGEVLAKSREEARWKISGQLEVDCMSCHSAGQSHDPAEAARQIEAQNFKWSPTIALGLGVVRGEARKVPDDWDPTMPPNPDYPERAGPKLIYDLRQFDRDDRVFFDITRRPPVERCYFCHSFREVGPLAEDHLAKSRDVHLAAGLICSDCHRNELDHLTVRGFDGEAALRDDDTVATLTCEGCHLGSETEPAEHMVGRYGAPRPEHPGFPTIHFEKLACTVCHSGPWPAMDAHEFQTALAHGLGLATRERKDTDPPEIGGPIFVRQPDGKLGLQRSVWPSYWGHTPTEGPRPLLPAVVQKIAGKLLPKTTTQPVGTDREQIKAVLAALRGAKGVEGEPWCVRNGTLFQLNADGGQLVMAPSQPCMWSLAHNVRPASQSLGIRACTDCHAADTPVFFGVATTARQIARGDASVPMARYHGYDSTLASLWATSFQFRSAFKWFGFACAAVIALVLIRVPLDVLTRPALAAPTGVVPFGRLERSSWAFVVLGTVIGAVTGLGSKWLLGRLVTWALLTHMIGAGLFLVGVTAAAVLWARRCRGPAKGRSALQKLVTWLVLGCSLTLIGTMLAAMTPLCGYRQQALMAVWHYWAAIVLLVLIVVYAVLALAGRGPKGRTS